jgi:hypothetical protein
MVIFFWRFSEIHLFGLTGLVREPLDETLVSGKKTPGPLKRISSSYQEMVHVSCRVFQHQEQKKRFLPALLFQVTGNLHPSPFLVKY